MKKLALRFLKLVYAGLVLSLPIYALADYSATQSGTTLIRAFDATHGGTALCAAALTQCPTVGLVNSAGAEIGTSGAPVRVDPTGSTTQPVSLTSTTVTGSVAVTNAGTFAAQLTGATNNINNIAGTVSLPTGASTAAKQPALGTAGTPSADVISTQGNASNAADGVATGSISVPNLAYNMIYNGTTWDRVRGDTTNGIFVNVKNANANGQATMANSSPVVIASNQSNLPINITQVNGATVAVGSGVQATAERFTLATDSPGIITLGPATAANSVPMTIGPALLGSYCMGANTGTMAAGLGAAAPVYSFRYGGANLAIVRKVSAEADDITTAFVAGAGKFDLFAARSFSASDTGGTAATLTGNNGKLRTSFATTAISDLRISSTATLTAGTRTLDAQPLATVEFAVSTTIDGGLLPTTDLIRQNVGESPLVLANNEGFVIQATVPGTGTWVAAVRVCWDEVTAF